MIQSTIDPVWSELKRLPILHQIRQFRFLIPTVRNQGQLLQCLEFRNTLVHSLDEWNDKTVLAGFPELDGPLFNKTLDLVGAGRIHPEFFEELRRLLPFTCPLYKACEKILFICYRAYKPAANDYPY